MQIFLKKQYSRRKYVLKNYVILGVLKEIVEKYTFST